MQINQSIILASGSEIRAAMLSNAGVPISVMVPRIDETMIRESLSAEGALPRDIADCLAEAKARKVSQKEPDALIIGADQVLDFRGHILSKPQNRDEALEQLVMLRSDRHQLLSAAVVFEGGEPVWRHVGQVRLTMRDASDTYLEDYISRNWSSIRHSVGSYKLEEEGVRLFTRVEGDYFSVLGLPLIELLSYLSLRGKIPA